MTPSFSSDPVVASARERASAGAWQDVVSLLSPRQAELVNDGDSAVLLGEALTRCGEERRALVWLRQIEPILAQDGDRVSYRRAMNIIGVAAFAIGELDEANAAFVTALELASQAEDLLVLARATNNIGTIANLQGNRERALSHYRIALPTFQRLGQRRGLASSYHNIAITLRDLGELEEADENERRAIEYATDGGIPRLACMGRIGRAEIALRRGDAQLAEMTARLAAEELMRLGDPLNEADSHRLVGAACAAQQKYPDALEAFDRALGIAHARGHALNEAETLRDRVQVRVSLGDTALAIADAEAAIAIFGKLGAFTERAALEVRLELLR
jgi:tetratricopeptide (TPR) repeat protein